MTRLPRYLEEGRSRPGLFRSWPAVLGWFVLGLAIGASMAALAALVGRVIA